MAPTDPLLARLTYKASPAPLTDIPWAEGLAPTPLPTPAVLPEADVLVVTWTAAEAQALADVLSPGHPSSGWAPYAENWSQYEPQLTWRSPAKEAKCLGRWALIRIGEKKVVLYKSELHMATDTESLPLRELWQQLIATVKPGLVITTGTAGGIGQHTVLGDVCVTNGAKFNCRDTFKDAPFAQSTFQGSAWTPGEHLRTVRPLLAVNAGRLAPIADRTPKVTVVLNAPGVETVDYFGFADATDSYGIIANDPHARTEEMDDATLPLALEGLAADTPDPLWLSIRNASDPQVPHMASLAAEKKWAGGIYEKYGYWTTVGSAIACWAVIADLA